MSDGLTNATSKRPSVWRMACACLATACLGVDDDRPVVAAGGSGAAPPAGTAGSDGSAITGGSAGAPAASSGTAGQPAGSSGGAGTGGATAAGIMAPVAVDATPGVRLVGRFDGSDAAGPRFAWSGSGIIARFSGTSAAVRLTGAQQYTVVLDGVVQPKLISTGDLDPLAQDLAPGEHTIELYRRTEANQGEAQFLGFDFGDGQLLAPPPAPERRIELIGDSISAGYGNEGADMSCPFSPDTENHYLTYGAIAARAAGADLVTVAWSGKGVVCNYGDEPDACADPMPLYVDRVLPERADSRWDFAAYQPQAVIINLGTNDFSTTVDPSTADFEAAYVSLLERVRAAYPEAAILCAVGPLLSGTDLSTARAAIDAAVQTRVADGDVNVSSVELAPNDPANGYGCDYHPSLRTHEIMAEELTSALRAELGW